MSSRRARKRRRAAARSSSERSKRNQRTRSLWLEAPAGSRAAIEGLDRFAGVRNAVRSLSAKVGEYAGVPLPLEGERLVFEPSYAFAKAIGGEKEKPTDDDGYRFRNSFWSVARRSMIVVMDDPTGKVDWGLIPGVHHLDLDLRTLGCADAWGIEQESAAVHALATLVSHRQFKHYMLTGSFLETSERSGVTYFFRRLKPTVALSGRTGEMRILCALCLHPIAYYAGSWAGAMTPTDDVMAHLMLMRGDERMFWRRANQHASYLPEAGL